MPKTIRTTDGSESERKTLRAMTDDGWYRLASQAAGIGAAAVIELVPGTPMPARRILEALSAFLTEEYGIAPPEGYRHS